MPLNYNKILEYNFGNNSGEFENIILIFSVQYPVAFSFAECIERTLNRRFSFSGGAYGKEAYENRDIPARETTGQI
jgi:hypothetical protein